MGLFDDVLKDNESVIKNDAALDFEFLPKRIPYREQEQEYMATCIKPLFQNRSGRNLLIHGAPGIGKTAAVRSVLRELEDKYDVVETIYVNCWQHNTSYKILLEICDVLGYRFTHNKKTVDLFKVAAQIINKKSAVLVFDEIDKAEDLDFLYFFLEDIHRKSIFLLTNYKSWLIELDTRIRSRLMAEMQEFRSYNLIETKGILTERVGYAFHDGVIKEDVLDLVVNKTFDIKDIRSGIFLLKESALLAEDNSRKEILKEDVLKAIKKLEDFTIKSYEDLDREAQIVYDLVKSNSGAKIGDLYDIYKQKGGSSSYKTFQRKIAKLSESGFINAKKTTGVGGNTTIVERKLTDF
ncbi:MAG: Cdc6/Cdc18 family protein [Candidatus Woesearchaeota archaeon]